MKFGCCSDRSRAKLLSDLGFDYIEMGVSKDLLPSDKDSSPIEDIRATLSSAGIPVETFNLLLPGTLKVIGPDRDLSVLVDYVDTACARASALGGKILVFGSGGSRRIPESYDYARAADETVEFLRAIADPVKDNGLVIAIEPLRKAECNFINSVAEGCEMVRMVDRPDAVLVLSDLYHVTSDGQSFGETSDAGSLLRHVHVACGADRHAPTWDDQNELVSFFQALTSAGYNDRVSIEATTWGDYESDAATGLDVLKSAWSAVSSH